MNFVWIPDEQCWGKVLKLNQHYCIVEYTKDSIIHEELFLLEDVIDAKELGLDYEIEESTEF